MSGAQRRQRGTREALGQITLGFELVVVFLAALVFFGLKVIPAVPALVGGGIVCLATIVLIPLMSKQWAVWCGWALQIGLFLAGFAFAAMFFIGGIFLAIWAYAMIAGSRIDRQRAAYETAVEHEENA